MLVNHVKSEYFRERQVAEPIGTGEHLARTLMLGLQNLGMLYKWVSSGTMLGLYRDGRFIPEDTDIDVSVLGGAAVPPMMSSMAPWEPFRQTTFQGQVQQVSFITEQNVIFDVNFYYLDETAENLINLTDHSTVSKPLKLVLPASMWDSPVGRIPAPNDIEAYLEMRYGDWKTPSADKGIYLTRNQANVGRCL